jgi:DNA-binding GntR family transcriptional regulator
MAEQVTDLVRNMILVGELRPGQRVTHDDLAARLNVSTMPVREALLRLSYEGLIVGRANRSFHVAEATRDDVADIYWMHGVLAGEITARAAKRADDDLVTALREIQQAWGDADASAGGHAERLDDLNGQFHRHINRAAASPKLLVMLRNTLRLIPEHFYALLPAWSTASLRSHQEIIDAIAARDGDAARAAAERHVHEAGELLIEHFDDLGFWNLPDSTGA